MTKDSTYSTTIKYTVYRIKNGLLLEPKNDWDNQLMFPEWFDTQEQAQEAIQNNPQSPSTLVILPLAVRYWE